MKLNREQKDYIETKKALEALEEREHELEADFVKKLGVKNEDGSIPSRTWAIDDDKIADQAIDDFGALVEECGLWKELCEAKEAFRKAEERLVNYAISIIPCKKEREILTTASSNLKYRIQIIETVMKLDTKTISD
jgi:hypothetical protein